MLIRDAVDRDWALIYPFFAQIVAEGRTYAVVETNTSAVALWHSLGFRTIGTVPQAFDHPDHGYVGLHVMWLDLTTSSREPGR